MDEWVPPLLTEGTRAFLCVVASGDLARPLPCAGVDWDEAFQGLMQHHLLGLAYRALGQRAAQDGVPAAFVARVQNAYRISALQMALMYRRIGGILDALNAAGLDYLVVKGPALAQTVYPNPILRLFTDLDLVVRERDWAFMHHLLLSLGFQAEENLPAPPPKLVPRAVLYECKYRHPETHLLVEVHYDDLLNAGLASRDGEGFWQRALPLTLDAAGQRLPIKVLSLEDQFIHLCAHAHYHGYTRLGWLADLAILLRERGAEFSWARVLAIVRREEAQVSVYYTLRLLERLLGVVTPPEVRAAVTPDHFRRWLHERLLPEAQLVQLAPMWRPDFSFYHLPLLKRMLPDLLVMGRRGEKLRYLLRLLCPPAAWLRYYYGIEPTRPLAPHYLLHPIKLAYHYAAELLAAVRAAPHRG